MTGTIFEASETTLKFLVPPKITGFWTMQMLYASKTIHNVSGNLKCSD